MREKIIKFILYCTLAAFFTGAVSGCTAGDMKNEKLVLKVGNLPNKEKNPQGYSRDVNNIEKMKKVFPDVEIQGHELGFSNDTFMPLIESGEMSDLYNVPLTETQKIIKEGYCRDITEQFEKSEFNGIFSDVLMKKVSDERGRIYGIPSYAYIVGMYYNINIFREAGLVKSDGTLITPNTYDELAEICKVINDKTGKAGYAMISDDYEGGWAFMNIAWSFGTEFVKNTDGKWKAVFNSPECLAALRYVSDLKWKYDVVTPEILLDQQETLQKWADDQVAIIIMADDKINTAISNYGMDKDNIASSPMPAGPAGRYTLLGGDAWFILPKVPERGVEALFKWLEFRGYGGEIGNFTVQEKRLFENFQNVKEYDGIICRPSIPMYKGEYSEKINEIYDKYTNIDTKMYRSAYCDDLVMHEEEPVLCQQLYKILSSVIQSVLADEYADIEMLLAEAEQEFQTEYLDKIN